MSLTSALNAAVTGLAINQRGLEIASHNIGNANTEGYSRRVMHQETISGDGFASGGVRVSQIERVTDDFLTKQVRTESATLGRAETRDRYLQNIQVMFGTIGSDSSIAQVIADLSTQLESLAVEPESSTSALAVIDSAVSFARDMNTMSDRVLELRNQADVEIDNVIDDLNRDLETVARLNQTIASMRNTSGDSGDLLDARDAALKRIGSAINIRTFERSSGEIVVYTGDSLMLVDGDAVTIEYQSSASAELGFPLQTIEVEGESIQSDIRDGRLKGLLEVRDKIMPNLHAELDALAAKVRDVVNLAHNRGMGLPPANSLSGVRQFENSATDQVTLDSDIRFVTADSNGIIQSHFDLPAGAYTVDELAAALNTGLGANGTAVISGGRLVISAADATLGLGIADLGDGSDAVVTFDDGSGAETFAGFSNFFGLNNFFETPNLDADTGDQNASTSILVRTDLVTNPERLSRGRLSTDAAIPVAGTTRAITIGDGSIASAIASSFSNSQSFDATGGLPPMEKALHEYAAEIIGLNSQLAADASERAAFEEALIEQFQTRLSDISGVSIDEELANILALQNAFSASARVLTTVDEMMQVIIQLKR